MTKEAPAILKRFNKTPTARLLFRKFPRTLAREIQKFLVLSPVHDLSANNLQVSVHIVKVAGILKKRLEVWATTTNTQYISDQIKLLDVFVTRENVLQIRRPNEVISTMIDVQSYGELRDEICKQVTQVLNESFAIRK